MGEAFLDRLTRPERPAQPVRPVAPAAAGATPYAAAALVGEVENLLAVPVGSGRNDQLNRSAVKMYGLAAAGEIDEHTVTETLGAADGGLDYPATERTLRSARDAVFGRLGARAVPEPPHTSTRKELAPWEQCDDPLADGFVWSNAQSSTGSTSSPQTSSAPDAATSGASTPTGESSSAGGAAGSSMPDDRQAAYAALVKVEASKVRLNRDARRLIDHEDALRDFRPPPYLATLTDELQLPDEPVTYRVDQLIPTGANVLLTAQYKTGKTTLVNNLARALVDGEPFLGRYDVDNLEGRVALFNYEVDGRQYRRWLRDVGIGNTDAVAVLNLRGYRLPLMVPHVEDWVVEWLQRADVRVWIVDPFARAATGIDENSNTEVGAWLDTLDVIKQRAGIGELVLPTHTGRGEQEQGDERARGATRLDDWADVRWLYTKDKGDTRYFRATGRDVETDEAAIAFEPATRLLTITGGDRWSVEREAFRVAVLSVVEGRPGVGARELRDGVKQIMRRAPAQKITDAIDDLLAARKIHTEREGHTVGHYLGPPPYRFNFDDDPLAE